MILIRLSFGLRKRNFGTIVGELRSFLIFEYYTFSFSDCLSCLKRYSCLRVHHVRGDLALALMAAYIYRIMTTRKFLRDSTGAEFVEFHDGVGASEVDQTKLGHAIYFLPGRAQRRYETTEADSPARYFRSVFSHISIVHIENVR